jgi:hypothetical protein
MSVKSTLWILNLQQKILNPISQFEREKYVLSEALVEDGEDLLEPLVAEVLDPLQAVVGERHPVEYRGDKCSVVNQKRYDPHEKVAHFMFQI